MAKSSKTALPTNDAWTGMLAISLLALLAGCVLLFLDWNKHSQPPNKFSAAPFVAQEEAPADGKGAPQPPADPKKGN
ncbi:MAG TPA: hypothetical protein VEL76_42495 [Gemmataceae bacterium]|nr:hypothetical protein [Gemmataceae bacterium]